jgi:hypothetical protein
MKEHGKSDNGDLFQDKIEENESKLKSETITTDGEET